MKDTFHVVNYDINGTVTIETHGSNAAFRYAISKGLNPEEEFVFVNSIIDEKDEDESKATRSTWWNLCNNGITLDNYLFGNLYVPLCATASGAKMVQSIWVKTEHLSMFSKHFRHGFKINGAKMEPNKFFTRLGLFFSTSTPIEEVYPNFNINFDKMHIMQDVERNGHNASDSICFIFDGDNNLPSEAASLRPAKVLAVPVNKRTFLDALGFDPEYKTPWGETHKVSETQVLLSESGEKFIALAKNEAEQVNAVKEAGVSVAVRMNKHALKHLKYQPLQTLNFSEESIEKLSAYGCDYLNSLNKLDNFVKLLPKNMREAVAIYPQLVLDPYIAKLAKTVYKKERFALRGGALPRAGKFYPICPDLFDLFGGNGLKAGECCCLALPEGYVVMLRYPHTSKASWVVLYNRHINMGITDPNVMVLNNYDKTLRRLGGADYDGDKVYVITDKEIRSIVMETLDEMGNPTEMPDTPAGHARKVLFDKASAKAIKMAYFTNLVKPSQIGFVSNQLSCAYANLYEAYASGDKDAIADAETCVDYWLQMVEITVDIEKHGNTFIPVPEAVKKMNKLMPKYIWYSKIAKNPDKTEEMKKIKSNYEFKANHPLEKYSENIRKNTTLVNEFAANVDGTFFYENLLYEADMPKMNTKVFNAGEPVRDEYGNVVKDENGVATYINEGQFDRLVFATSDELRKIAAERNIEYATISDLRKQLIERLMGLYCDKYGCTMKQVYNLIVYHIYTMSDNAPEAYKRTFWECLNDYATDALIDRFGSLALSKIDELSIDDAEDEDEEDIDF